jgi:hypothetical protein
LMRINNNHNEATDGVGVSPCVSVKQPNRHPMTALSKFLLCISVLWLTVFKLHVLSASHLLQ